MREVTMIVGARHMGAAAANAAIALENGAPLILDREPNNPSDRNAIIVRDIYGRATGYVQREVAAIVAKWMDEGYLVSAKCIRKAKFDGVSVEGNVYYKLYKYPRAAIYREDPPAIGTEDDISIVPPPEVIRKRKKEDA